MRMLWPTLALALAVACSGKSDDGTGSDTGPVGTDTDTDTVTTDTDTEPSSCDGVAPSVAIGTGVFSYEPLSDGQATEIVQGPQDGWHLDTAGSIAGIGPVVQFKGVATVVSTGDVIGGENDEPVVIDLRTPGLGTWDDATCSGTFYGQYTFIDDFEVATGQPLLAALCSLDEEDVEFTLEVAELEGETYTDTVTIFARVDPDSGCP
jgi:hypothetical protein